MAPTEAAARSDTPAPAPSSNTVPWTGVGIVLGLLVLLIFSLLLLLWYKRRRRRLAQAMAQSSSQAHSSHAAGANGDVLGTSGNTQSGTDADEDQGSIRALRQRRWTSRNGQAGITVDELDLVAPLREYVPMAKRTAHTGIAPTTDEDVDLEAASDGVGDDEEDTCAVCLDEMMEGVSTRALRCGHEFHALCIEEWITKANRCPVCNVEALDPEQMAKRRNVKSSARRGIDNAILAAMAVESSRMSGTLQTRPSQRRRRSRGANGAYELRDEGPGGVIATEHSSTALQTPESHLVPVTVAEL